MATTFVSRRIVAAAVGSILAAAIFAGAQQQQLAGKTAEQAFKNIQVLKEIPAEQVVPTMRVMAGSLGVNCGFCHVEDRSKDDLMTKQTARKMITMMMNINKDNFDARQEVTCYTCHKGTNDPVSTIQYSDEPAAPRPGGRGGQGPSADQILANYVQALGGEQAIRKVSSVTVMETRDAPAPQGGPPAGGAGGRGEAPAAAEGRGGGGGRGGAGGGTRRGCCCRATTGANRAVYEGA